MPKNIKLYERLIPSFVPNVIALALFSIIAFFSGPVKNRIRELHFEENTRLLAERSDELFKGKRHIENQADWSEVRFGSHKKSNMSYSGCEIIATYNALHSLSDDDFGMPALIRYFEQKGIALKGGFGITPAAAIKFFRRRGYEVKRITTRNKEAIDLLGGQYQTFIVTFYWNVDNIKDQLHTVNISKEPDGFYIHNNYCKGEGGFTRQGAYKSLGEAVQKLGKKTVPMVVIGIRPH